MITETTGNYRKKLIFIALPIMLSSIISQLQMLIDKIFLGRLDIIYMSAVGNATSPMWITMDIVYTLTAGATILISHAIGSKDEKRGYELTCAMFKYSSILAVAMFLFWILGTKRIFTLMGVPIEAMEACVMYTRIYSPVFLTLGVGASVASMLQNSERTKSLLIYGIIRSLVNIMLDWAMIFGHLGFRPMGIKGAALATVIAEFTGMFITLIIVIKDKKIKLKPGLQDILAAKFKPYIETVKMGVPSALENFAWNLGNLSIIVLLNTISPVAAGIYTIIFSVELLPICAIGSLGNATLTLCGQETGRKNYGLIKRIAGTAVLWCLGLSMFILVMFIMFPATIMSWFTTDTSVIMASGIYLAIVGFDLFPKSGNIIIGSAIKGYGDTKWMLYTQIFGTVFVISVATIAVKVFNMGMTELFCVVVADEMLRSAINYYRLRKISGN